MKSVAWHHLELTVGKEDLSELWTQMKGEIGKQSSFAMPVKYNIHSEAQGPYLLKNLTHTILYQGQDGKIKH